MEVSIAKSHEQWAGNWPIGGIPPTTIRFLRSIGPLSFPSLSMEGGTYSLIYPGLPALDGGWTDIWKKDNLAHPHDPQIREEVYPTGLNSSLLPGSISRIYGGGTTYPESVLPPTFPRPEGVPPALIKDQYSPVDSTSNFKVSPTLTENSRKKCTSASFQPARRPAGMRGALELSYSCDACGKRYSQPQGVSRHRRRAHNPHSCLCCEFKWSRPYQYRTHLKKHHPGVDSDYILGKPEGSRCRSTIIGRDLPHYFLPAVEPDRHSGSETRKRPFPPPLSTPTNVPSPAMPPVAYDLKPKYAEQAIRMNRVDYAHGLEYQLLGASLRRTHPFDFYDQNEHLFPIGTDAALLLTPTASELGQVGRHDGRRHSKSGTYIPCVYSAFGSC